MGVLNVSGWLRCMSKGELWNNREFGLSVRGIDRFDSRLIAAPVVSSCVCVWFDGLLFLVLLLCIESECVQ